MSNESKKVSTKSYILDANVILNDPKCLTKFGKHDIIIPMVVLSEIDGFKKGTGALSFAARQFARQLDKLRAKGTLQESVPLPTGGTVRVVRNVSDENYFIADDHKNDHVILTTALKLAEDIDNVILVTKDILLRILADGAGLVTEDYQADKVDAPNLYEETKVVKVTSESIDLFYKDEEMLIPPEHGGKLAENQYLKLQSMTNNSHTALAKVEGIRLKRVRQHKVGRIEPRNAEQVFLMDAMLDPDIKLITVAGRAGTGKTITCLAGALDQVGYGQRYDQLVVTKPVVSVGKEIGFLPGSVREKVNPWLSPFYDNLSIIMKGGDERVQGQEGFEQMENQGMIEVQALSHIRGRSIPNSIILIDEAQGLSQLEVKTIVTRAGEGSKIVVMGDPSQIDSPYLDEYSNGLAYLIDKFRGQQVSAHIALHKGERSELAELAATLL